MVGRGGASNAGGADWSGSSSGGGDVDSGSDGPRGGGGSSGGGDSSFMAAGRAVGMETRTTSAAVARWVAAMAEARGGGYDWGLGGPSLHGIRMSETDR